MLVSNYGHHGLQHTIQKDKNRVLPIACFATFTFIGASTYQAADRLQRQIAGLPPIAKQLLRHYQHVGDLCGKFDAANTKAQTVNEYIACAAN